MKISETASTRSQGSKLWLTQQLLLISESVCMTLRRSERHYVPSSLLAVRNKAIYKGG